MHIQYKAPRIDTNSRPHAMHDTHEPHDTKQVSDETMTWRMKTTLNHKEGAFQQIVCYAHRPQ